MPPTLSKFQDGEAKLDRTSTFGSASGSSPAKGKRRKGWEDEIREAVDVAIKISPKLNGVVSIMFPKQHVQLREVVKLIMDHGGRHLRVQLSEDREDVVQR